MARWEPNTAIRLVDAALDLFVEQGYDATTVSQIADRAGLTRTTFFRHFPDKREVLFAGQEVHAGLLADALAGVPAGATPLDAVGSALDALTDTFTEDRREFGARLRPVIAAHRELQERAALKRIGLAAAVAEGLGKRGVPEPDASLAADLGVRAFYQAYGEWSESSGGGASLTELTHRTFAELRAALAALG
ncbi:helix-turn-helix domain-containing protein [Streptomyces sp. NPDC047000]|uniref:TetR/AcrR family transcriptional regulator n=1 Tax=Streptomyces sp. NPDC047000 TaxID=3155474 RepID=UPI0033DD8C70